MRMTKGKLRRLVIFIPVFFIALGCIYILSRESTKETKPNLSPETQQATRIGLLAAELGEWGLAIDYLKRAQEYQPDAPQALRNLALVYDQAGYDVPALIWYKAYSLSQPRSPDAGKLKKRIAFLKDKIAALAESLVKTAEEIAPEIVSSDQRDRALRSMVGVYLKMGNISQAEVAANKISDLAAERLEAYEELAMAKAKSGDIAGAKQTADSIVSQDYPGYRLAAFQTIAEAQMRFGDIDGAIKTVREMPQGEFTEEYQATTYSNIARRQAKLGNISGALKTAAAISKAYAEVTALYHIASARIERGDFQSGMKTWHQAAEINRAASNPQDTSYDIYNLASELSQALAKKGRLKEALEIAQIPTGAERRFKELSPVWVRNYVLYFLIRYYLEEGDIAAAEDVRGRMDLDELSAEGNWTYGDPEELISEAKAKGGALPRDGEEKITGLKAWILYAQGKSIVSGPEDYLQLPEVMLAMPTRERIYKAMEDLKDQQKEWDERVNGLSALAQSLFSFLNDIELMQKARFFKADYN